jgi:hypothetical protein
MKKLIVAFRNFANAPELYGKVMQFVCVVWICVLRAVPVPGSCEGGNELSGPIEMANFFTS